MLALTRRKLHTKSWNVPASPGGTLKVRLPTTCSVKIYPLDPHTHDWKRAQVDMHVLGETDDSFIAEESARQVTEQFNASVISDHEPGRSFIQLEAPPETTPTTLARNIHLLRGWIGGPFRGERPLFDCRIILHVGIPGRFDLDVEVADGAVSVDESFEGDVKIHTRRADVLIAKLKSMFVDIDVDDGNISADVVQGNVSVRCMTGNIDVGRVQGPAVRMVTDVGDIQVRAMYADYAMMRSREGTVRLGCAQGYTKIRTVEGNVEVGGVEGRLDIESDAGDVEANLSVPHTVSMRSRYGDIAIGLSEAMKASFLFEGGKTVDIDKRVNFHALESDGDSTIVRGEVGAIGLDDRSGAGVGSVHARAPSGDVAVCRQGWGAGLYHSQDGKEESFPRWVENR